jgi:hypothetical protein
MVAIGATAAPSGAVRAPFVAPARLVDGGTGRVAQIREIIPVAYLTSPPMSTHTVGQQLPVAAPQAQVHAGSRMLLHLVLAAVPLLAISAQVFGFLPMRLAAALVITPLVLVIALLSLFAPHGSDRITLWGFLWGVVACVVYDVFRLDTVYLLGLWGDFIPTMGSWVTGGAPGNWDGAVVGYLWRYIGDGGGIGIAFFISAAAIGLGRCSRRAVVSTAVVFAVFPVWAGLIATVALAPRGEEMMFPLTATTLTLSLIGHLIFGLVLGLGFWRSRGVQDLWPWPPLRAASRNTAGPSATPGPDRASEVEHEPMTRGISRATYDEWERELVRRRSSLRRVRRSAYGLSPNELRASATPSARLPVPEPRRPVDREYQALD